MRQYLNRLEEKEEKVAKGTTESKLRCKTNRCAVVQPLTPLPAYFDIFTVNTQLVFILL